MKMGRYFRAALILSGLTQSCWSQTPATVPVAPEPQTWAVVVGVDQYQVSSISPLRFAGSDAKMLATTLKDVTKIPEKNIFLFTTDSKDESMRPSLANVIFRLDWLAENVAPRDTVIFYFAGHGVTIENETFLLTEDTDNRSSVTTTSTGLAAAVLTEELAKMHAEKTLVMLDACRNDPIRGRGDEPNLMSEQAVRGLVFTPKAVEPGGPPAGAAQHPRQSAVLFACSVGERSWEWEDRKHGFFTYEVVQALNHTASSGQQLTLGGLVNQVQTSVQENTKRHAPKMQVPIVRYDGPGQDRWVVSKATKPPVEAAPPDNSKVRVRGKNTTTKSKDFDYIKFEEPTDF